VEHFRALAGQPSAEPGGRDIETDLWFGPLFTNFRLTKTDTPVQIRSSVPCIQVQPIPQLAYREETLSSFKCLEASDLSDADWDRLGEVLLPHPDPVIRQGHYAVAVRKRRTCPFDHSLLMNPKKSSLERTDVD
jgi:hypothetical protein